MNAFAHITYAAKTDVGRKRKNNEDAFGVFPDGGVFCVADGMGGGDDGEIASAAVVKSVGSFANSCKPPQNVGYCAEDVARGVAIAVNEASSWICSRAAERKLKGCGSTFVGICFDATAPSQAVALHAGDSRLYRIRGSSIKQITKDHSAMELIGAKDESAVNPCFRGVILRAVGIHPSVDVERTPFLLKEGDKIVICSDGLSKMVDDRKIAAIVHGMVTPETTVDALVAAANKAGGADNITAVVLFVGKMPPAMPTISLPLPDASTDSTDDASDADTSSTGSGGGYKPDTDTAEEPRTIVTTTAVGTLADAGREFHPSAGARRTRVACIAAAVFAVVVVAVSCGIYLVRRAKAREAEVEVERQRSVKALAEASVRAEVASGTAVEECRREDATQAKADDETIAQSIAREHELRQDGGRGSPSKREDEPPQAVAAAADGNAWESQVLPRLVMSCVPSNSEALVSTVRRFPVKGGVDMLLMRFRPLCDEKLPIARRRAIAASVTADMQDISKALRKYSERRLEHISAALADHELRAEFKKKLSAEREGLEAFMAATEKFLDMDESSDEAQTVCADVILGVARWFRRVD